MEKTDTGATAVQKVLATVSTQPVVDSSGGEKDWERISLTPKPILSITGSPSAEKVFGIRTEKSSL